MRRVSGMPDYQFGVTPYPVGNLTLAELDDRARNLSPDVVRMLREGRSSDPMAAAAVPPAAASAPAPATRAPDRASDRWQHFADEADALDAFHRNGWTDGLPVVIPTAERIEAFLATTPADADDIVVAVPTRGGLGATVRDVAGAAVMAGCRPEELRVVLGALRAANEPAYNLHAHTATMAGAAQVLVVNGPVRHELGLASGNGSLGPGWRPNASIGRAFRLVIRNALGSRHGEFDRAGFSTPARFGWCIAEAEEASPFPPLAVRASGTSGNAVTVYATVWQASVINHARTAEALLDELALAVRTACHANWLHRDVASDSAFYADRPFLFVTGHEHARVLGSGGYADTPRLQASLFDRLVCDDDRLEPVAIAGPAGIHFVYVHATGMQQTWFFAPFQSHGMVTVAL
jgi:hypothetical protein